MEITFIDLPRQPNKGQLCICKCPEWCDLGCQVAMWNGDEFEYPEQSNDRFNDLVIGWIPINLTNN